MSEAYQWLKAKEQDALVVEEKTDRTDVVTQLDRGLERFIIGKIEESFPDDAILGEEKQAHKADWQFHSPQWVIDPIDGTMNFVQGRRHYGHILAFYDGQELIFGLLVEGDTGNMLMAVKGEGVYYKGEKLTPPVLTIEQGLVEISGHMPKTYPLATNAFIEQALGIRVTGSAALAIIDMALGARVGYVAGIFAPWDMVVARLIAQEWGWRLTDFDGADIPLEASSDAIFASPTVYPHLLAAIQLDRKK